MDYADCRSSQTGRVSSQRTSSLVATSSRLTTCACSRKEMQKLINWMIRHKYDEIDYVDVDNITFMDNITFIWERSSCSLNLTDDGTFKHPRTPMTAAYDLGELRRMDEAAEKWSPSCDPTAIYRRVLGLLIYALRTAVTCRSPGQWTLPSSMSTWS